MVASHPLPTGPVTFLFTDIEGSTRLTEEHGPQAYGALLERHRAALRAAFQALRGVEVGTEGDSFFVVFRQPADAVEAAAEGQRRLAAVDWPPDGEIRVRMGIHSGEGFLAGDSYVGSDVNRAARVASAAHGGQVLLSETAATLVSARLGDGIRLRDLGEHRLKDLRPERIWQLEIDGLRETFPPIRSLDARPNNLPTQLTSFIGRERELAEAESLLAGTRLLTLTGPGGTGKTRLGLQVAANAAHEYPGGVFFVALEPIRDPALVGASIAGAVGIVDTGRRPPLEVLAEWLASRQVLLVLDNFEQVVAAAPLVADLLRAAPAAKCMVTSRAPLHVSGEQEYPVPGLPAPPDLEHLNALDRQQLPTELRAFDPETIGRFEAVRLFIARATSVHPDFVLADRNAPAVAAITNRLHGMPLAIELAAARVRIMDPSEILGRLDRQLRLLTSGARDLPERQRTLNGAIAWSYDLLDEGLRRLLERLSVFVGGWDLAHAEAVSGSGDELGLDVLDGLEALVDQSLVRCEEPGGGRRFYLLDTIREFAGERLEARGEAAEIRRRHTEVYCALAHQAADRLSGDDQRDWLDRLEREHDNIRAALDRTAAAGDGARAIPLAFAMWRFWQKRGHLNEARRRLEALAAQPWARDDPRRWAQLAEAIGGVAWWQADVPTMKRSYEEAVRVWRELGDLAELANALYNSFFPYSIPPAIDGDLDPGGEGPRRLEESRALFRQVGDDHGVANTLWATGNYFYFRNQRDAGVSFFREALEIFRRGADRTMEAWSLHMLGSALLRLGDLDGARRHCREALGIFHDASDTAGMTLTLDDLSAVAVADGDLPRAARLRGAARSLTTATGTGLASFVEDSFEYAVRPSARKVMDPAELERYSAEGATMTLDDAVSYALDLPGASPAGRPPEAPAIG